METEPETPQRNQPAEEQGRTREPHDPSELKSKGMIGGLIAGFMVIVVSLFGIHTDGLVYEAIVRILFGLQINGLVSVLVGGMCLILALALSGILIGLMVFRGAKKKIFSRAILIGTATLCGI